MKKIIILLLPFLFLCGCGNKTYKEITKMMELMKEMQGPSASDENTEEGGMQMPDMDMLLSMLSPEQQAIVELLKGGQDHE